MDHPQPLPTAAAPEGIIGDMSRLQDHLVSPTSLSKGQMVSNESPGNIVLWLCLS